MNIYKIYYLFGDAYKKHQFIREIFPGNQKVLWQDCNSCVCVVAEMTPVEVSNSDFEVECCGSVDSYLEEYFSNDIPFSVRLNACQKKSVVCDMKKKSKRVSIPDNKINSWVDWKLSNIGASISNVSVKNEHAIISKRHNIDNTHCSVLVTGILKINNLNLFKETLHDGIGHSKGYGFGLLNIFSFL